MAPLSDTKPGAELYDVEEGAIKARGPPGSPTNPEPGPGMPIPTAEPTPGPDPKIFNYVESVNALQQYVTWSGKGATDYGAFVILQNDEDLLQIKTAEKAVAFEYLFAVGTSKFVNFGHLEDSVNWFGRSWVHLENTRMTEGATVRDVELAEKEKAKALQAFKKSQKGFLHGAVEMHLSQESHAIYVPPNSTCTIKNAEGLYAEKYKSEGQSTMHWFIAVRVVAEGKNLIAENYWSPKEFGQDIDKLTYVRAQEGWLRFVIFIFTGGAGYPVFAHTPMDMVPRTEELGGTTTGGTVGDTFGKDFANILKGFWDALGPTVQNVARLALVIILFIIAILILYFGRGFFSALLGFTARRMTEALND